MKKKFTKTEVKSKSRSKPTMYVQNNGIQN